MLYSGRKNPFDFILRAQMNELTVHSTCFLLASRPPVDFAMPTQNENPLNCSLHSTSLDVLLCTSILWSAVRDSSGFHNHPKWLRSYGTISFERALPRDDKHDGLPTQRTTIQLLRHVRVGTTTTTTSTNLPHRIINSTRHPLQQKHPPTSTSHFHPSSSAEPLASSAPWPAWVVGLS
jgi:hypothetical protein